VIKKAVIDLGTNTFNLLIAEIQLDNSSFSILHTEKIGVALGMGGINEQKIGKEAFERGIDAIVQFKNTCEKFDVTNIQAIGTSALRDAKNKKDFIETVFYKTRIQIEIISGEQEANYIYQGVCWLYNFDEPALIMDIGGGSTEFIFADKNGIIDKRSFDIGVSRIYQEFSCSDPFTHEDAKKIENWLNEKTKNYFDDKKCEILLGASGSFETFHEMIHLKSFDEKILTIEIPFDLINNTLDKLIFSSQKERDEHQYIIPIRRKMIPIAALKTKWVIEKVGINKTFVTPCSLKEGVLKK
jgi:exopolyphosphatase / guanosine-5'-triphosphate,3'-diphosphate pyrophosphatase